jgi:murein DD-endopeptidase MepM/ murein hydrolase activator NlpD
MFTYQSPIPGARVVSGWGRPREYRGGWHEGLDFAVPDGTPVHAAAAGTVVTSAFLSTDPAGEMISIAHPDGSLTRYMHLSQRAVTKGQAVRAGQLIGYSGHTGIKQSAAHLHFDLRANSAALVSYKAKYGTPHRLDAGTLLAEFGRNIGGYTGIPAETFVPAALDPTVVKLAGQQGIPVYKGGSTSTLAVGAMLVGGLYVLMKYAA